MLSRESLRTEVRWRGVAWVTGVGRAQTGAREENTEGRN